MFNIGLRKRVDFLEKELQHFKFRYTQDKTVWEFEVLDELVFNADDNTDRVTVMDIIPRVDDSSENEYRVAINKNEKVFNISKLELEKQFKLKE